MGGILRMKHKKEIGAITLPQRERIKVAFENGTPEVLKKLVLLDPACIEAAASADLVVGTGENADLRLVSDEQSAFEIGSENGDAESALQELVAELSLRQIDANALAADSGRLIDVQVIANDRRRISLKNLFTGKYNFLQSRAGPIFVACDPVAAGSPSWFLGPSQGCGYLKHVPYLRELQVMLLRQATEAFSGNTSDSTDAFRRQGR